MTGLLFGGCNVGSLAYHMNKLAHQKKKYGTCRKEEQCKRCHKYKRVKGTKYCKECTVIVLRILKAQHHNPW